MDNFIVASIETHLFFARIMKEHSFFLQAGFPGKEVVFIQRADQFRQQFEDLLRQTVEIADGLVNRDFIQSEEMVTRFTIPAETKTSFFTGIPIDSKITVMEQSLRADSDVRMNRETIRTVQQLNVRAIRLLNGLIDFKETILREVRVCRLFTANYPLLIEHILREARMYRMTLLELGQNRGVSRSTLASKEEFWNQIMMEHALFIRGLLDPTEETLIDTADEFATDYKELLELARLQELKASEELTKRSLEETLKYREFKIAGAEGILECRIQSIILPLLADHVLREANHYIRILETSAGEGGR